MRACRPSAPMADAGHSGIRDTARGAAAWRQLQQRGRPQKGVLVEHSIGLGESPKGVMNLAQLGACDLKCRAREKEKRQTRQCASQRSANGVSSLQTAASSATAAIASQIGTQARAKECCKTRHRTGSPTSHASPVGVKMRHLRRLTACSKGIPLDGVPPMMENARYAQSRPKGGGGAESCPWLKEELREKRRDNSKKKKSFRKQVVPSTAEILNILFPHCARPPFSDR